MISIEELAKMTPVSPPIVNKKDKPESSYELRRKYDGSSVKSCYSTKYLNSGGDGNNYSSSSKVGAGVYIYTNSEYMVGPDDKTKKANGSYSINYS